MPALETATPPAQLPLEPLTEERLEVAADLSVPPPAEQLPLEAVAQPAAESLTAEVAEPAVELPLEPVGEEATEESTDLPAALSADELALEALAQRLPNPSVNPQPKPQLTGPRCPSRRNWSRRPKCRPILSLNRCRNS